MRTLILTIFFLSLTGVVKSQFFTSQKGAVLYYEVNNKKNGEITKDTLHIDKVETSNNTLSVKEGKNKIEIRDNDKIAIEMESGTDFRTYKYSNENNITYVSFMNEKDAYALMQDIYEKSYQKASPEKKDELKENYERTKKNMQFKGDAYITLNPKATKGDKLPESEYSQKIGPMKIRTIIDKGTVDGFETLTTPAGKFECIKVSYRVRAKMLLFTETSYITEWYAENVGLIKSIERDEDKNENLIRILTSREM